MKAGIVYNLHKNPNGKLQPEYYRQLKVPSVTARQKESKMNLNAFSPKTSVQRFHWNNLFCATETQRAVEREVS